MTSYPNPSFRTLSDSHRHVLFEESASSPPVETERGTFSARRGKDVPQEHGWLPAKPGIVFPVHTLDGGLFYRLRLDNPGRFPKYMQPKGHPNRLDVHPRQHERIKRPGGMRYLTEGEKKVNAGVSRDMLMVGVSGVFNGQRDKGAALIDDWDYLPLEGERYAVLFDSDILENPNVQLAADRYARLLRKRGAEVYITLLPPAPDGSKQGLDDFFANGGTVKEIELLTRPYESVDIGLVRLSRDEKLSAGISALRREWYEADWMGFVGAGERGNWARGHTARDTFDALLRLAARRGKLDGDAISLTAGVREIADEAAKSRTSVAKSLAHLEAGGALEILPPEDRAKARTYRLLVGRATLDTMVIGNAAGEGSGPEAGELGPRCQPLRAPTAPRLRWSKPGRPRRREFEVVKGTSRVRHAARTPRHATAEDLEARPYVKRLGPHRAAVVDLVERAGGEMHLLDYCEATMRKRPRDVRRRILVPLEEAGIITVEDDVIRLVADWLERLEAERVRTGEVEQAEEQRKKHRADSRRFREHLEREKSPGPSRAGRDLMERGIKKREECLAAAREQEKRARAARREHDRRVKRFVYERVRLLGKIRLELLQEVLADAGYVPGYALPAAKSLGCEIVRLPEYDNEEFVFAPPERAATAPSPESQEVMAV
ncbi:MAG: hypothetical protein CYG60_08760 [Actinobacteria bacterium]|nr:MAG: hypothetical protein CYG60_08760 [Actinomycetota bacterium]